MIEIIFLDVDGCLTDGGLYYTNSCDEFKKFNVKDGYGIEKWIKLGKKVAIITGKTSKIVENRAKDLKIDYVYQGIKDKLAVATEILKMENLNFENAAAIGDDYNDLELLKTVKFAYVPKDAMKKLTEIDDFFVLDKNGGCGAVREMIEKLVEINGEIDSYLKL